MNTAQANHPPMKARKTRDFSARTSRGALLGALAGAVAASSCYRGGARPIDATALAADHEWVALTTVPVVLQQGERDCGAAAAAMLLGSWGMPTEQGAIRAASGLATDQALSAGFLRTYLHGRGLQAFLIRGTLLDLERELRAGRPVLVGVIKPYLNSSYAHYQLVIGFNRSARKIAVIDPADGWREYSFEAFAQEWAGAQELTLVVSAPAQQK